jgi:hypothetical protein
VETRPSGGCTATARLRLGVDLRLKHAEAREPMHACTRVRMHAARERTLGRHRYSEMTEYKRETTRQPNPRTHSHLAGPTHMVHTASHTPASGRPREPAQMQHVQVPHGRRAGRKAPVP